MVRDRLQVDEILGSREVWKPIEAISPELATILQKCLKKDMTKRYQSADELDTALHQLYLEQPNALQLADWVRTFRHAGIYAHHIIFWPERFGSPEINAHHQLAPKFQPASKSGRQILLQSLCERLHHPVMSPYWGWGNGENASGCRSRSHHAPAPAWRGLVL